MPNKETTNLNTTPIGTQFSIRYRKKRPLRERSNFCFEIGVSQQ